MTGDRMTDDLEPTLDDETCVEISVVHGSVANAEYPLMIGGFAGEQLAGLETFLDRQFGGLLTSWSEIDLYPRELATARFIETSRTAESETEPPGAYIVGLGAMMDLGREELTYSVRQALVDRCMRLYREQSSSVPEGTRLEVGVSSTLIGVREENGLRVEDSVAGIVEGVLQTNVALKRFESTMTETGRQVRVTALELIDRFAERANLAAVALRSLATAVQLSTAYEYLRTITVETRPGGLPLGAALTEATPSWRRFLITAVDRDDPPAAHQAATGNDAERTLLLDVAVLGRDARADRIRHRLDRSMVDALVERISSHSGDARTAATLYDQLIPHDLRSAFQTTSGVQFVVDSTTANYPWELLGAPRPSDRRQAGGSFGGAIRQFTESDDRRLNPERAGFGRALVIAAGNVPGESELPSVYAEAELVADVLGKALPNKVTLLDDRRRELDLVRLQNELFGEYQVLHIASHGVYEEGRPDATGAVLAPGGLLTVDTIRQLRFVPDVVFLNSCSLGRIGMNRVAAGLAREFMAIGVRALVAAAWPIDDSAASAFAETFYTELIAGRPLGDAITRARNHCAEVGGNETWAAYQCYGDPGFVLRGARTTLGSAVTSPVSDSDLVARLETLAVRTSDLGRPGRGGVQDRRERLLETWTELASWIDSRQNLTANGPIQRRLGTIARDLAEYRSAADRFRQFVIDNSTGVPVVGAIANTTSVADLQQTANCLARAAQREARQARSAPDSDGATSIRADIDLAIELAQAATNLLPNRESLGVLASAFKRAATVDLDRRADMLTQASGYYRQADECAAHDRFGAENAIQLALLVGGEAATWAHTKLSADSASSLPLDPIGDGTPPRRIDQRRANPLDFWSRADIGDRALTALIAADDDTAREAAARAVTMAYEHAFASRSTWSERQSALDHLDDLTDLLPDGDVRRTFLQRARHELDQWEQVHVEETMVAPDTAAGIESNAQMDAVPSADPASITNPGGPTEPKSEQAGNTPAAKLAPASTPAVNGLNLIAFPAACGDCLLLEWGADGGTHRILVDGGMDSAYSIGLGAFIATLPDRRMEVDVAVVTHIDLDHISGMITALRSGSVVAPDVWFNGLDEIRTQTRGPRQGDELTTLLTAERRNRPIAGRAIVVPDEGPLPSFELAGGLRCTVLSPTVERLRRLEKAWTRTTRGETGDPIGDLLRRLGDDIERGTSRKFGGDSSVANGSSIALLVELGAASVLLAGDAYAGDLESTLKRLLDERGLERLAVDVFKLPHHGSMGNVTEGLLGLIQPARILVCTDGSRFGHPDVETIELIRRQYPDAQILFTDDSEIIRSRATLAGTTPPVSTPVRLEC
jgi:CHAT domain-containing protein/beta-lactamase superfamily II metal-dependent hydrolase/tetratricopeptide (TPR) repeat protein